MRILHLHGSGARCTANKKPSHWAAAEAKVGRQLWLKVVDVGITKKRLIIGNTFEEVCEVLVGYEV